MKLRIPFMVIGMCVVVMPAAGQNLCTNGDFDAYTTAPNSYAQICRATGWTTPSGLCSLVAGTGSPDYYHAAGSGGALPPSTWWATVSPHSGGGMSGFATWYTSNNYREYVSRQLSAPLVVGQTYEVTFWFTNGISWLHLVGTNNLGVNFSLAPLTQSGGSPILLTPQLETSVVLYDTAWKRLSFTYTATAPYQYVTIGNFHDDANTLRQSFGSGTYANYGAYYYIDDVVIRPAVPLPVSWLYVEAAPGDGHCDLAWATASESGAACYVVEKNTGGVTFDPVGTVAAAGYATSTTRYGFTDERFDRPAWYRIRQVDLDGQALYSETVYAGCHATAPLWYLEPAGQALVAQGDADGPGGLDLALYDGAGRQVRAVSRPDIRGRYRVALDLEGLPGGVYTAVARLGGRVYTRRVTWR